MGMTSPQKPLDTGAALARIDALLDAVDHDGRAGADPGDRLAWCSLARRVAGRLSALVQLLVHEAESVQAAVRAEGLSTDSWLAGAGGLTGRQARQTVAQANAVSRHAGVQAAALAGQVAAEKVPTVVAVLDRLPEQTTDLQRDRAEQALLALAAQADAAGIARHADQVLSRILGADDAETTREVQAEQARRDRFVSFTPNGRGSVVIRGSLPSVEAEPLVALVEAYAESARRRGIDARDSSARALSPGQRRADALCALVADHQRRRLAPSVGGDRPRIVVTVSHERLCALAAGVGLVEVGSAEPAEPPRLAETGEPLTVGELRRLCCDADVLPVVLGGSSEVLDVGRARRLVTPGLRTALVVRDEGCVFPGCEKPPRECEAHHIVPWQLGGPTSLANLVLLCHRHHGLLEPGAQANPQRWEIRLGGDGIPEVLPPLRVDPGRRPRRHQRLSTLRDTG